MELDRIENLLEKYFEGETTIAEENELKVYFSSSDVAQRFESLPRNVWLFLCDKRAEI